MTKKFTEEHYLQIIEISDKCEEGRVAKGEKIIDYMFDYFGFRGANTEILDQALAIANPLTREWAHEQFVEKERKYIWNSKKKDNAGYAKRLFKSEEGMISDYSVICTKGFEISESDEELTESEIQSWGYNSDLFDKEEV